MSEKSCGCGCSEAPTLIFSCSGSADVGEISDRAARKLNRDGAGKMFCLAGIGGHVNNFIMSTGAAGKILVIDGCTVACAKKTLEHAGFNNFEYVCVTDYGCLKGKTPVTDETIDRIVIEGKSKLTSKRCCS